MSFASSIKVLIALAFLFVWSYASQAPPSSSDLFKQQVAPIFAEHCAGCHGAQVQRSGLDLRLKKQFSAVV
jgi:mono/diheme cytochrome c family protein